MKYHYYPGCSLQGTAKEYDLSTRALFAALGEELVDIDDWTCCGASAAEAVSRLLSLALPARNLALTEKMNGRQLLVPCSACYLNQKKVEEKIKTEPGLLATLNQVLAGEDLQLKGEVRVRHLLEVLSRDVGPARIKELVKKPLANLTVAPYYGCQALRPYKVFDDPEAPTSMEPIIQALGARIHPWRCGGKCCGASHMTTKPEVGLELVASILKQAKGADVMVTVCPMCQMNLEAYQKKISRKNDDELKITVLYLPQLLGLALGLAREDLRIDLDLAVYKGFWEKAEMRV